MDRSPLQFTTSALIYCRGRKLRRSRSRRTTSSRAFISGSREQESELKIHIPISAIPWGNDIRECLDRGAHRLLSDFEYLAEPATDRDGPAVVRGRQPVRRYGRVGVEIPALRQVVVEDVLRAECVDLVDARAAKRPAILQNHAGTPRTLRVKK